jgi:hypothetical protein
MEVRKGNVKNLRWLHTNKQTNKLDNSSELYVYKMIISRLTKRGFSSLSWALDKKMQAISNSGHVVILNLS